MSHRLFTIGYEKARLADVVATLVASGVATLIDVRDRPISRRPGFSKHQLAAAVEAAGIRYLHLQALGTPPEGREAGRRREWPGFWVMSRQSSPASRPSWRCTGRTVIGDDVALEIAVLRDRYGSFAPLIVAKGSL